MDVKAKAEAAMKERISKLHTELSGVRTGRANPQILEGIKVEYYGQPVPIKQVAAVSVPEGRTLERLGIDNLSKEELLSLVKRG